MEDVIKEPENNPRNSEPVLYTNALRNNIKKKFFEICEEDQSGIKWKHA